MRTNVRNIRLDAETDRLIIKMAAAKNQTVSATLRDLIKSGISVFNTLDNERKTLAQKQKDSLHNFGAKCTYKMLIILQKYLLKNDLQAMQEVDREAAKIIDRVIGVE